MFLTSPGQGCIIVHAPLIPKTVLGFVCCGPYESHLFGWTEIMSALFIPESALFPITSEEQTTQS